MYNLLSKMDSALLEQVPDEYKPIYKRNWNTIRTSVKRGLIKEMYHYPLIIENSHLEIMKLLQDILKTHNRIKINVAFGFILRQRTTEELKFFHPSNNTMLFVRPRLIENARDKRKLLEDVESEDVFEYARLQRPSTNWVVARIICVRFDVYKLNN